MAHYNEAELSRLFSQSLKRYMAINNETQADVAKIVNVSKATVTYWMSGRSLPRMDRLAILSKHYGTTPEDFLSEQDPNKEILSKTKAELIEKIKTMDEQTIALLNQLADSILK